MVGRRYKFLAKKIVVASMLLGGAILLTVGSFTLAHALTDPDCRNKLKDCADRLRGCKDKMCNSSPNINGTEEADKSFKQRLSWKIPLVCS